MLHIEKTQWMIIVRATLILELGPAFQVIYAGLVCASSSRL
jgi:hypothetical protein